MFWIILQLTGLLALWKNWKFKITHPISTSWDQSSTFLPLQSPSPEISRIFMSLKQIRTLTLLILKIFKHLSCTPFSTKILINKTFNYRMRARAIDTTVAIDKSNRSQSIHCRHWLPWNNENYNRTKYWNNTNILPYTVLLEFKSSLRIMACQLTMLRYVRG